MDYQQITCLKTNKTIKADEIYKIRDSENLENIVSVCHNCPYSYSDNNSCKKCYGTIVQSAKRNINTETGRIKMKIENYQNNFNKINDNFIDNMEADIFLKKMEIISNLNNCNWCHGNRVPDNLRAYDGSRTSKTDCYNCKNRYKNKKQDTPCEKAKKYIKSLGFDMENITESELSNIKLKPDMICSEQVQRMFYV